MINRQEQFASDLAQNFLHSSTSHHHTFTYYPYFQNTPTKNTSVNYPYIPQPPMATTHLSTGHLFQSHQPHHSLMSAVHLVRSIKPSPYIRYPPIPVTTEYHVSFCPSLLNTPHAFIVNYWWLTGVAFLMSRFQFTVICFIRVLISFSCYLL